MSGMMQDMGSEWVYRGHLPPTLDSDPPARASAIVHMQEDAVRLAREQGHTLTGAPVLVEWPSVMVPNWSEEGDGIVGRDVARTAGLNPDDLQPGPTVVVLRWSVDSGDTPTVDG